MYPARKGALDPAAIAKYGVAGAKRRAFRQAAGVSDIRSLSPAQLQQYKQGGSGMTQGLGFTGMGQKPSSPDRLLHLIAQKRKGGPAGGRPVYPGQKGGPAGGKPVLTAARRKRRHPRLTEDSVFNIGPGSDLVKGLRHYHSGTIH